MCIRIKNIFENKRRKIAAKHTTKKNLNFTALELYDLTCRRLASIREFITLKAQKL